MTRESLEKRVRDLESRVSSLELNTPDGNKRGRVKAWLLSQLDEDGGESPAAVVNVAARKAGIGIQLLKEVKHELGVESVRKSDGWWWRLP